MAQWLKSACQCRGDMSSILVWKDSTHTRGSPSPLGLQACALSPGVATTEPTQQPGEACTPTAHVLHSKRSHLNEEACTLQLERSSHLLQLEKALMQPWRTRVVNKLIIFFNEKENIYIINCPNWCLGDGKLCCFSCFQDTKFKLQIYLLKRNT